MPLTIPAGTPRVQYTADGAVAVFAYTFPIFEDADLDVYLDDALQSAGYAVSGAGETAGGDVTFDAAPANGVVVTLVRNMTIERTTDFQAAGAFRAAAINDELDRIAAWSQDIARRLEQAVTVPDSDTATLPLELPATSARADRVLGFDSDGEMVPVDRTDMGGQRLRNVGAPQDDADAATRGSIQGQVDAAQASATAAASSESAAAASETAAGTAATDARLWASEAEDVQVDDGTHQGYSAYHWQAKAAASAAGLNLPAIDAADAGRLLRINGVGDGYETYATVPTIGAGDAAKGLRVNAAGDGYDLDLMPLVGAGHDVSTTNYQTNSASFVPITDSMRYQPRRADTDVLVIVTLNFQLEEASTGTRHYDYAIFAFDRRIPDYAQVSEVYLERRRPENAYTTYQTLTMTALVPAAWTEGLTTHVKVYARRTSGDFTESLSASTVFIERLPQ